MRTLNKSFSIYEFLKTRPLSWSAKSSFDYDLEQWYQRYILGIKEDPTEELKFGKLVGEKLASDFTFMPCIPRLSVYENELNYTMKSKKGDIPMIGFMDAYSPKFNMDEYKTGKKAWTQERADTHGQIDMYLLMHFLINKVPPEKMTVRIFWMPTKLNGDFTISFVGADNAICFPTKRTTRQVLDFSTRIKKTVEAMQAYVRNHN